MFVHNILHSAMLHQLWLGSSSSHSGLDPNSHAAQLLDLTRCLILFLQSSEPAWQASAPILHFPLTCPFLQNIAAFLSSFRSPCTRLWVPTPLAADLFWVHFLIQNLLNQMPLVSPQVIDLQWWGDASTSFGIGVVIVNWWAIWKWLPGFQVGPKLNFNIGWAKAIAIELSLLKWNHVRCILTWNWTFWLGIVLDHCAV